MTTERAPERLDLCLIRLGLAPSRRSANEYIQSGRVRVNGRILPKGASVAAGDRVELVEPAPPIEIIPNPEIDIPVLYADAAMIVVNKPGLMPCHPIRAGECDTVINAVAARYPETALGFDKPLEGGLVHRLDNGTSGALIIARTAAALTTLRAALRRGAVRREYNAIVSGNLLEELEIATPIAHHPKNRRKMVTAPAIGMFKNWQARPAATAVRPLIRRGNFTLVAVKPRSGSRHQIRVHLASIGHPLAGDGLYGGPAIAELPPGRFWLHLAALDLDSPAGGRIRVEAPLPPDLSDAERALGF
jgi:23S rRNA pseudouridine1911/1915/1917 synthase